MRSARTTLCRRGFFLPIYAVRGSTAAAVERYEFVGSPDSRGVWQLLESGYGGRAQDERPVGVLEAKLRDLLCATAESSTYFVKKFQHIYVGGVRDNNDGRNKA